MLCQAQQMHMQAYKRPDTKLPLMVHNRGQHMHSNTADAGDMTGDASLKPDDNEASPQSRPVIWHQVTAKQVCCAQQLLLLRVFVTREHVRHNKSGIAHRGRTGINHLRELPTKLNHF
jgi:hypothetical protein